MKIPVFLPVTREFGLRDEFAQDCLLHRGVCKLSVPRALPRSNQCVHHVNPRIPNYRLEECHNADVRFRSASTLTLGTGLQALGYALWDSDLERLVPFRFAAAG